MANVIRLKRASGSDPTASDLVAGEPAVRTDTGELFFKKDDGSIAKVAGAGGGPDFKYLALRNAANNGAASYPNADFTLVRSGTTSALVPTAANTLLVSVNGVIQKPNTGTSTPSEGFALSGSTIKFGGNLSAAPDFILYQESGGIGEPSDETVSEEKLKVSNSPVNGYFLSAQSGNTGGLTWAAPVATSCTGNSATATALATARTINGTSFDGTSNITVTAAAATLTGTTLNSSVVTSSLTSLGDLAGLTVNGDMVLTGANYSVLWDKSDNRLEFGDSAKLSFGNGPDLTIFHNGNHAYFQNNTGSLILQNDTLKLQSPSGENMLVANADGAVELYHNNIKTFETVSNGIIAKGTEGADAHVYIFADEADDVADQYWLRTAADGTGLYIQNYVSGSSETNLRAVGNGAVELYYDNSKKLETTSSGVTVTGGVTASAFAVGDNQEIRLGDGNDLKFFHNGNHSYIADLGTGDLRITGSAVHLQNAAQSENMLRSFENGAVELFYDNSKKFETSSTGVTVNGAAIVGGNIEINQDAYLKIGASNDLQLYHVGGNSEIYNASGNLRIRAANNLQLETHDGEMHIKCVEDGQVELYQDAVKKFETTAAGVKVDYQLELSTSTSNIRWPQHSSGSTSRAWDIIGEQGAYGVLDIKYASARDTNPDEISARFKANDSVELYHNNSKKFETTSSGIYVNDSANNGDGSLKIGGTNTTTGGQLFYEISGATYLRIKNLYRSNSSNGNNAYIEYDGGYHKFLTGTGGTERMRINSSGNLLLGTTSISGTSSSARDIVIGSIGDGTHRGITFATTGQAAIRWADAADNAQGRIQYSNSTDIMTFHTDNAVRMALASDGKVGIGTTSPSGKLDIVTGALGGNVLIDAESSSGYHAKIVNDSGDLILGSRNTSADTKVISKRTLIFQTGSSETEAMRISSSQNVGIGNRTSSPDELLHVHTSSGEARIHVEAATNARVRIRAHNGESIVQFADAASSNPGEINYVHSTDQMTFRTNGSVRTTIDSNGHVLPATNNTYDLGSTSYRWRNVYTNDLNLSNEGGSNDVDGTWGSYTIQEGAEDLFLVNKRNGKKYKFNLTEVS